MRRYLITALGAGALALASTGAFAVSLDSYTLNFSAASSLLGAAIPDLNNVDEWGFVANSVVAFQDNDSSGGLSAGDTFYDWVAVRVHSFFDSSTDTITPLTYGTGPGRDHEITLIARFGGIQTTANTYQVTFIDQFDFFFDAGPGFTGSTFTNLSTFADGLLVEQAELIASGGVNTDPTLITGTLSMILSLQDILHTQIDPATGDPLGEFFEVDNDGNPFPMELLLGIVDANNNIQSIELASFASYFGFTVNADGTIDYGAESFDFFFTSRNDGSFNKHIVPEPGTMILLGSGLLGLAGIARRRHKS
ncbi:MAG: PEP-CTERM sorting domain-containing protein [Thermodesulfobacteriota bacterium]